MSWKYAAAALIVGIALPAIGKLPPPTPEEQKAVADKKAAQQKQMEREKVQLEKAQDRVVQRYRKESGNAAAGRSVEKTSYGDMPKTTKELPGGVGPKPGQPQSAEAHSGEVK
jgi:phage repressor protein C with HTH and peptisase S24 domain